MKETSRPQSSRATHAASSQLHRTAVAHEHGVVFPVQCKLTVGAVDDPLEADADAVAGKVIAIAQNTFIQRK